MRSRVALIVGGGIGGLSAALTLSGLGWRCRILERRPEVSEAGAGIQIGPNGMRILEQLGVGQEFAPLAGIPHAIQLRDGRSGALLTELPLGAWIAARHGAPYWTAHRADLHAALVGQLNRRADTDLALGFEVTRIDTTASGVSVQTGDGRRAEGDILIGADGINSAVRRLTFGDFALVPTGRVAARAVVANDHATTHALGRHVGVWLAAGAHAVHYPVRGGSEIALVVVTQDATQPEGWNTTVDARSVLAKVKGLAPELLGLLERATSWRQWSLVTTQQLPRWSRDRTVLLGDATQPVMPFLAQGAVMALEDAAALGRALGAEPDHRMAFPAYESARRSRKLRVQQAAARNGKIYHLDSALAVARNLTLRAVPGTRLMAAYDWLYGHRS